MIKRKFIDEIAFSIGAIIVPACLVLLNEWASSPWTALGLFLFFIVYLVVDYLVNESDENGENATQDGKHGTKGIILIVLGLLGIVVTGNYLGMVAESIVNTLNVPEWAVGWILGLITSLPELTTFFAVFAAGKNSLSDNDCQESLDNLAASNMSNLGSIYPIGIVVFLLYSS